MGIKTVVTPPPPPLKVEPVLEKIKYDINIPLTRPIYAHNYKRLSDLDPLLLEPIYDQEELEEPYRIRLKMEFATTKTEVHQEEITPGINLIAQDILAAITNKVIEIAKLGGGFSELYPILREYVVLRCFGTKINLDKEEIRSHLSSYSLQHGIAKYLAKKIGEITAEKHSIEFENIAFKLSDTKPFRGRD